MKCVILIVVSILLGCGDKIISDPIVTSTKEVNYPSVEMKVCGQYWNGIALCNLDPNISDIPEIEVLVPFSGILSVYSNKCEVNITKKYETGGFKTIKIPDSAKDKNCVYAVSVIPKLPGQVQQNVSVHPLSGHIVTKYSKLKRHSYLFSANLHKKSGEKVSMKIGPQTEQVTIYVSGCRSTAKHKRFVDENGYLTLELDSIIKQKYDQRSCIIEGAVGSKYKNVGFTIFVNIYGGDFSPIPEPDIKGDTVYADDSVAAIGIDGDFKLGNKREVENIINYKVISLLTTKGRTLTLKRSEFDNWNLITP